MKILLFEDNPGDVLLIREMFKEIGIDAPAETVERLGHGMEYLKHNAVDVILLDMNLPDSRGLDTVTNLLDQFPHLPVVIMTSIADEELAMQSLRLGAQDYLVKGKVNGELLYRATLYAIERKKLNDDVRWHASLLDMSHDAIFCWELGGGIIYWNAGSSRLYGFESKKAVGKVPQRLLQTTDIDISELYETLKRDGKWEGELTHVTQRGEKIVVDSWMMVVDQYGIKPLVLETNRDVSARKHMEEELRKSRDELEIRIQERTAELRERAEQLVRLSSQLTLAEQRERRRIAMIIHDHLQPLLVAAKIR